MSAFKVEIFSDNVCPWCYVGYRHLKAALTNRGITERTQVQFKPFFLDVNQKESNQTILPYLRNKYGPRADTMVQALNEAGAAAGIAFNDERHIHNTLASHRLVHLAEKQGKQQAVIEALFTAYFERGEKIGDLDTLLKIALQCGVEATRAYLESEEDADLVLRQYMDGIRKFNISGVPFFIITREGNKERITLSGAQPVEEFEAAFDALS